MSEFDKEAEREKLREKYERDRHEREATQQMSDLLLRGATMTNRHCGECRSPIFRYEGSEFCPTCEREVERPEEADGTANDREPASAEGAEIDVESAREKAEDAVGRDVGSTEVGTDTGEERPDPEEVSLATAPETAPDRISVPDTVREDDSETTERRRRGGGDLADARSALCETIAHLSRRAANADDPRRAEEFLAAADRAAETLRKLG
ncbi:Sjogren's syndrome/scleroderma autoantigen 1 family protein [Natronorarus salvus]|uniref:Sjogren's syndrome/scleroderma autoantigen 1 family protein n=1 Tax=Natronorarus salvus TaxID=3117733 RepID=UPI002F265028